MWYNIYRVRKGEKMDELSAIKNWIDGLPDGRLSAGVYVDAIGDKISITSTWGETTTEEMTIDEFKDAVNPYGHYPWA